MNRNVLIQRFKDGRSEKWTVEDVSVLTGASEKRIHWWLGHRIRVFHLCGPAEERRHTFLSLSQVRRLVILMGLKRIDRTMMLSPEEISAVMQCPRPLGVPLYRNAIEKVLS